MEFLSMKFEFWLFLCKKTKKEKKKSLSMDIQQWLKMETHIQQNK